MGTEAPKTTTERTTSPVAGQRVVVVGLGRSGLAAAGLLLDQGAHVTLNDHRADVAGAEALAARGAELAFGHHEDSVFADADRIVVSPGVPPLPAVERAAARGVPVASEVELASWFVRAPVVAVTGTNGKSTVTSLLAAMAMQTERPVFVGGNLGTPLVDVVGTPAAEKDGLVIVELSSFQLERVDRFRAHVAVLLNVTDDHLDRYEGFGAYAAAKGRIFAGQTRADHAVVPHGDALCLSLAQAGAAPVHRFGRDVRVEDGVVRDPESGLAVPVAELGLTGGHNVLNAMAAALAGRLAGFPKDAVEHALRTYRGLPHRMSFVRELEGVRYFDDSKATNVGAAVAALAGFDPARGSVVLIAGGRDKGGSYGPLAEAFGAVGRALVTLGEAAPLIEDALGSTDLPIERADTMEDAVARARRLAQPGDAVVLAPACSSFDMFRSYAERGDVFAKAVADLEATS